MNKNPAAHEFDENFFSSIAVPKVKDYSRLSSSPSRDQPCDSSYFEKHFPNLECDTPVKMRLPTAQRESDDALPTANVDLLSSSSASEMSTVNQPIAVAEPETTRQPLKIVPNETAQKTYGEAQLIENMEKLTMFQPKEPEERLSQRRRSEQKKRDEEETKRRSMMPPVRSISSKRSVSREPSSRPASRPASRSASVTRTIAAPIKTGEGVVTRAMAAKAAESAPKVAPPARRGPLKVVQKTPVAAIKKETETGDRSRDRTRRTNTTGSSFRRSVMPASGPSNTPVPPPRRSASANKTGSATKMTPKAVRPIATPNRSSMLRMNMVKPTAPPAALAAQAGPAVPAAPATRTRQPLRVNPGTPSKIFKKPLMATSGQRPVRQPQTVTRTRSVDRGEQQQQSVSGTGTGTASAGPKTSRTDLFNRLAMPKAANSTPTRVAPESGGPSSSIRKSAVRPVPSYVYNVNKGIPSSGGLHGIRAPSKDRSVITKVTPASTEQPTKP